MYANAKLHKWIDTMNNLLNSLDSELCQPYSICIVPGELRQWNENAYEPKVVSIGPRYKGRMELQPMEEIKLHCIKSLFMRIRRNYETSGILSKCMRAILELDTAVRASYWEEIKLDSYDLAAIMVFDGCFLLELLVSASTEWNSRLSSSFTFPPDPGAEVRKTEAALSDLTLLENQIPLFILYKLFQEIFPCLDDDSSDSRNYLGKGISFDTNYIRITKDMALSLFGYSQDLSCNSAGPNSIIAAAHFLEFAHSLVLKENHQQSLQHLSALVVDSNKKVKLNRCATRLQAAGITLKCEENSVIPISKGSKFDIKFSYCVLEIPSLLITQTTEAKWRNFIAWEHHKKRWIKSSGVGGGAVVTFFALLFNDLICCASDVQLLKNKGIIVDHLSMSNHDVVDLFCFITNGVDRCLVDSSVYSKMIDALNNYSATNHVVRFPIILWHYLSRSERFYDLQKFLRRGYNFAAALITLLTVIQTCYAVLSYHYLKNN